jgi:hypothetical protein
VIQSCILVFGNEVISFCVCDCWIFIFFLYCCSGLCFIVAFTKVLTVYQLYHTGIHPLLHSPDFWNSFNRYNFCIYMHIYRVFAQYSFSYTFSLSPPFSYWCQPSSLSHLASKSIHNSLNSIQQCLFRIFASILMNAARSFTLGLPFFDLRIWVILKWVCM